MSRRGCSIQATKIVINQHLRLIKYRKTNAKEIYWCVFLFSRECHCYHFIFYVTGNSGRESLCTRPTNRQPFSTRFCFFYIEVVFHIKMNTRFCLVFELRLRWWSISCSARGAHAARIRYDTKLILKRIYYFIQLWNNSKFPVN